MNKPTTLLFVIGAALLVGAGTVPAQPEGAKSAERKPATAKKPAASKSAATNQPVRFADFSVSEHVSGPEVDLTQPKGKLTVLYFWGYRCAPCMATLPKLVKLDHEYRSKGLVIVGVHAASGSVEDIRATCLKHGVEFPIYRQYKMPRNFPMNGLPVVVMFDEAGDLVFKGHYSEITKQVEDRFKN